MENRQRPDKGTEGEKRGEVVNGNSLDMEAAHVSMYRSRPYKKGVRAL